MRPHGVAGAAAALLAATACVLPASQTPLALASGAAVPTPGLPPSAPGAGSTGSQIGTGAQPGGTDPQGASPDPAGGSTGQSPGSLAVLADFNGGTPAFGILALPPTFDRATYQVAGAPLAAPKEGRLAVEGATGKGTALLIDLAPAAYLVTVRAFDLTGLEIAAGTASVQIPSAVTATASLQIVYSGRLDLGVTLPAGDAPTPSFKVSMRAPR